VGEKPTVAAATSVRKVTSATGSPPCARASASGRAVSSSSMTTTEMPAEQKGVRDLVLGYRPSHPPSTGSTTPCT
jgi:hypothetical protein